MQRFFWVLFIILYSLFLIPTHAFAANSDKFDVSVKGTYTVSENGQTLVAQNVTITNKDDFLYVPSYTVNLGLQDVADVKAYNASGPIPYTIKKTEKGTDIEINFPGRIVGKGRQNNFTFQFVTSDIAKKKGSIWEIDIPGIASPDSYKNYDIDLVTPDSFGPPTIMKPQVGQSSGNTYSFTKEQVADAGIFVAYGSAQYYDLKLSYHIDNPNLFPIKTEVALPPNTSYQNVLISSIRPAPINVYQDKDGNWLAEYSLSPTSKLDIAANLQIQVLDKPNQSPPPPAGAFLSKADYWAVDNGQIQDLAKNLKTPQEIYNYVVKTLSYNYQKVGDKNVRMGAVKSLQTPTNAVCLEFTDLFITLARAAGIPAREVEGFAYTDNSKLRPLSGESDVLHAWPEYYDTAAQSWIMVDPTWGSTTGGIDYFNNLDFDHIAFVIKGVSSTYPIPAGGYKTEKNGRDITVRFIEPSLFQVKPKISISDTLPSSTFPEFPVKADVSIQNIGNNLIPASRLSLLSSNTGKTTEYQIDPIPPFGYSNFSISSERLPFLTNKPITFTISFAGQSYQKTVHTSLIPHDSIYVIGGVFLIVGSILLTFAIRTWRLHLQK